MVEIVAHAQIGIVDYIVGAVGLASANGGNTGGGQVVGMDVVGEYIICGLKRRQGFVQALQRQAIGGVDAGGAQDADGDAIACAPLAQGLFGVDAAAGASAFGVQWPGFVNPGTCAIPVNPCRAYVNELAC